MKLLVITEQRQGKWNNASFETLAAAQQIAASTAGIVSVAVVGKDVAAPGGRAGYKRSGASAQGRARVAGELHAGRILHCAEQVIASGAARSGFVPPHDQFWDSAPALAAMLGRGMVGDCIGFRNEGGKLVFVRPVFQGKMAADVTFAGRSCGFGRFNPARFVPTCLPRIRVERLR